MRSFWDTALLHWLGIRTDGGEVTSSRETDLRPNIFYTSALWYCIATRIQ
jgi:hypothetical protein